jgi:hypothetical protein
LILTLQQVEFLSQGRGRTGARFRDPGAPGRADPKDWADWSKHFADEVMAKFDEMRSRESSLTILRAGHESRRSSITPAGVRPPLLTTATRAPAT